MHVALLTILVVTGAGQPAYGPMDQPVAVSASPACADGQCADAAAPSGLRKVVCDWFGPMPQTCYGPRYGCYPGNSRDIHRYPAFHGYYYREPYNYRHYFDYPWHAQPHEPLGYFSHVGPPPVEGGLAPVPDPGMMAPPGGPAPAPAPMPLHEPQASSHGFGKARLLGR